MTEFIIKYWIEVGFGLIVLTFSFFFNSFKKNISEMKKKQNEEHKALCGGMKALLRDRLVWSYNTYYNERGCITVYDLENVEDMYVEYEALEGNGIAKKLFEKIQDLPITYETSFHDK